MMPDTDEEAINAELAALLATVNTIALIGASWKRTRPAHRVMAYLLDKGFQVIPVNPGHAGKEILGQRVYARLSDIPRPVDMVDIFRPSEEAPDIVAEALRLPVPPRVIWMQLGVFHDDAAQAASKRGLTVVMNRCPKIVLEQALA